MPWRVKTLEAWNRRLHFYLGLYLLFFIWLFALTGLLLNHPKWSFADFWPMRRGNSCAGSPWTYSISMPRSSPP